MLVPLVLKVLFSTFGTKSTMKQIKITVSDEMYAAIEKEAKTNLRSVANQTKLLLSQVVPLVPKVPKSTTETPPSPPESSTKSTKGTESTTPQEETKAEKIERMRREIEEKRKNKPLTIPTSKA